MIDVENPKKEKPYTPGVKRESVDNSPPPTPKKKPNFTNRSDFVVVEEEGPPVVSTGAIVSHFILENSTHFTMTILKTPSMEFDVKTEPTTVMLEWNLPAPFSEMTEERTGFSNFFCCKNLPEQLSGTLTWPVISGRIQQDTDLWTITDRPQLVIFKIPKVGNKSTSKFKC